MRRLTTDDRGISAIWVAVVALFLVASAALAVDSSGAFGTAQTDQTTADLSCLAGVNELPDANTAINLAVTYAVENWSEMSGNSVAISGTTGTYANGAGNEVYIDAAHSGDDSKMYVRVTEIQDTWFAKVLGQDELTVVQEAWCRVNTQSSGTGVPFGAPLGGFTGGIFGPNPCGSNSGNCGSLWIPRDDVGGTSATLINNIALGPDRDLDDWLGHSSGSSFCGSVSAGDTCHRVDTDTGGRGDVERVGEQQRRLSGQGRGHRDARGLTARDLTWTPRRQRAAQVGELRVAVDDEQVAPALLDVVTDHTGLTRNGPDGRRVAAEQVVRGGERELLRDRDLAEVDHPAGAEVAVTGEPDEDRGERVVAWVVAEPGTNPTPDELAGHVADQLAPHKRPRTVRFLDELPRNDMGKVTKKQLR